MKLSKKYTEILKVPPQIPQTAKPSRGSMLKAKFSLTDGRFSHGPRALRSAPGDPSRQPFTEGRFCSPGPVCVRARLCVGVVAFSHDCSAGHLCSRRPTRHCRYSVVCIGGLNHARSATPSMLGMFQACHLRAPLHPVPKILSPKPYALSPKP